MANINSVITYNANLSPAQAQIKALTGQVGALTAAFNTLDKSALSAQRSIAATFAANVGQIGGFTTQTVKATGAVETFGRQLAANRLTMRDYFREAVVGYTRQNSMLRQLATQQVRYQQSIAVPTGAGQAMLLTPQSINAASSAAQLASQRFSIFNQLVNGGATAMLNWGKNTQWAGRQLMVGFTLPLVLFAGVMSKQFRELDKELTRFQKVYGSDLGNAVSESTQRMREQVQALAYEISSKYGIAAKETAALAADIAATGKEGEALMSSVQQTTRLAVLGEVDRQEAMKATLSLQSAFRMNTNELAESINFLNAVENQTSATLEDLATAIPKVGPVIRSLGGDVKDLATLLVAMREGGIPAAEAANALKSGLASLINPTKQASEVAKQFGVDLVGIVEANRGQLMPTIYAMQEALGGLDSFSRSRIIEQIFGKYQFARISALFDNIGRTGSQTQSVIELATKSSAELAAVANGEIRTLTESTAVKFQRTLEQLKNALMPIGQTLTETLIPVLEKVGQGVKAFSTFFSSLPDSIQGLAKWSVALTAIAGPVIMLVGLFGNLIANGLKFSMMIVRLGAKMAGLKTEKFQLLDEQTMAAKLGVDNLTTSFSTQEVALNRLVGVMSAYEASLRRLSLSNPALFIPGAVPGRTAMPIKRQAGSTRPEFVPGSGRGDKIPAMLEPGEFIVNRAATEKYAPVLMQMNRGTLKGFARGMQIDDLSLRNVSREEAYKAPTTVARNYPLGEGMARGHIFGTPMGGGTYAFGKRLRLNNQDIMWHQTFWKELSIAENSLSVTIAGSARNQAALRQSLTAVTKDQNQIERIMERATLGFVQHQDDLAVYKKAIDRAAGLVGTTGMPISARSVAGTVSPGFAKDIGAVSRMPLAKMTGFSNAEAKAVELKLIEYYRTLMGIPGQLAKDARIAFAKTITEVRRQVYLEGMDLAKMPKELSDSVKKHARMASPSRLMDEGGKGLVDGLNQGVRSRSKQTRDAGIETANEFLMGARSVSGAMGGTRGGIESISNAQKIAQADQSILRLKTLQQKATADRVRAEVELGALDARLLQIRNSETMTAQEKLRATLALNQERIGLEKTHQTALANETRIQNIINGYKERIASADEAQLRAEQEEARNAARRAAGSVGIGPGGAAGWLMSGVSPYASRSSLDQFNKRIDAIKTQAGPSSPIGRGGPTGPSVGLSAAKESAGMRGGGLMNAAFMASMAMSSVAMLGGASSDAAMKIGLFSTALMTATMMMQSVSAKGMFTNFLGMGSLANMAGARNLQKAGSVGATAAQAGAIRAAGMGSQLGMASRVLGIAGGPVGIAAAIGITGAITGFMMYRKAADEARERAIAAFNDPVKSAEYFGETIQDVSRILENNRLSNVSEDLGEIDQALREAVRQDYAPLIEQIKFLSAGAGAQELSMAYSNMIISGMSAENARAAIEAIAAEAGMSGGQAFSEALSQGMIDESLTIKDSIDNIIGQFTPAETKFGTSGRTILQTLESERDALLQERSQIESRITYVPTGTYGPPAQIMTPEDQQRLYEIQNALDGINDEIEDLLTVNPEMISGVMDSLVMAYQQDPTAAIEGIQKFSETISKLDEDDQAAAMVKITDYLKNAYGEEWTTIGNSIDTQEEKIIAIQMAIAGVSLRKAINDAEEFDAALGRATVSAKSLADATRLLRISAEEDYFTMIGDFAQTQRDQINLDFENYSNAMDTRIELYEGLKEGAQEAFETEQEARENSIEGMQDEMDQRREAFDEEMQRLDDRKSAIEKSSEAYIKSLEKNQRAESFYSQQRKTSLGALEKLASGDVFGFLQEREQMSADAQEFSYDQMITGIEERRDLELDAIDEVREEKQREQEEYEKMMEDRIQGVRDLMEMEQEAHDERMTFYDKQIEGANTAKENALEDKNEEIEGIKNIEKDYRENSTKAEETYSDKYAELKTKPYVEARKELMRLRIEEIYYRGGVTLEEAVAQAGALTPSGILNYGGREVGVRPTVEEVLQELGLRGSGSWVYNPENVGDTGVGDTQTVRDMTVDAESVTINGDITNGSRPNPPPGYTYDENGNIVKIATGGYIKNGRVNLQDGGGAVRGPGGPKSDVIPAMLSNGEYVIQASSVNKYGTDLMHAINAGRFADGGIVGYKVGGKVGGGGYTPSADRAEYNAKKKPTYFGGTPTSSAGYNKPSSYYRPPVSMGPRGGMALPSGASLADIKGAASMVGSFFSGIGSAIRDESAAFLSRFTSPFSFTGSSYGLYNNNPNVGYVAPSAMTGRTQSEYSDYVDAGQRDLDALLFASNFLPIPSFGLGAKTASLLGRSMTRVQRRTGMSVDAPVAARKNIFTQRRLEFDRLQEEKYFDPIIGHLIRLGDSPNAGMPAGLRLESTVNPSFTSPLETYISQYGLTSGAKGAIASMSSYGGIKPIRIVHGSRVRENVDTAIDALNKMPGGTTAAAADFDRHPVNLIMRLNNSSPEFAALSSNEKTEVLRFLRSNDFQLDSSRSLAFNSSGFDSPNWTSGQINMAFPGQRVNLFSTVAHELGHTTDYVATRSGYGQPIRNSLHRAIVYGRTEAYAESNRLRANKALLEDINADPEDIRKFTHGGGGVAPYSLGVGGYYGSPLFKIAYAWQMRQNMKGLDSLFDISGFSMRKSGILRDIITSTPEWVLKTAMNRAKRASGYFTGKPVNSATMPAMNPNSLSPSGPGNLFSLDMGMRKSAVAEASPVKPTVAKGPLGNSVLLEWVRRYIDEDPLDNVFDKVVAGSQGGISPGGWVIGKDGVRRYVKGQYDSHAGSRSVYLEALIANAYDSLGMNVPKINLLNIGQNPRPFPGNPTVDMARGSIIPADEFLQRAPWTNYTPGQLITSSEMLDNVKHIAGFFGNADTGKRTLDAAGNPIGLTFAEKQFDRSMRATLAKEGGIGKAVDTLFGLRDTHSGNYVVTENTSVPLGVPGRFIPYRIDFGSNVFQTPGGRSLPFDPSNPLKISDPAYGRTYGFGAVKDSQYRDQVYKLQEMLGDMGGIEGLIDPIIFKFADSAPQYKLTNPDFLKFVLKERLRAMVGNVRKYKDGGLVKSINKWFPRGGHQFYPGWNKFNSWAGGKPGLVMMHHTAGNWGQGELDYFAKDWVGKPVVQGFIRKTGTAHTLAGGATGHGSGEGDTELLKKVGLDQAAELISLAGGANRAAWQIEVQSLGKTKDFTPGQFDAIARMTAAIRDWAGWPSFKGRIINHKDWAWKRGKPDTLYDRSVFESNAQKIWEEGGGEADGQTTSGSGNNRGKRRNTSDPISVESPPSRGLFGILSLINKRNEDTTTPKDGRRLPPGSQPPTTPSSTAAAALEYAKKQVGKPYSFNAQPPDSWDCSKLTAWSWNQTVGKNILTPYSHAQANQLTKRTVGLKNGKITGLSIGDILYYKTENSPSYGHTAMYAGGDKVVQASSPSTGVLISDLNSPWNTGINPLTGKPRFQWAGPPKGYAAGGFISGPGGPRSDVIPAMLSNGEYVVKASSVAKYGKGFMDKLNSGQLSFGGGGMIPKYADGGMVGTAPMPAFNMPEMASTSVGMTNNSYGNSSSSNNSTNVKVIINGAGGKNTNAIANKVVSMINSANNRRNHSRSI